MKLLPENLNLFKQMPTFTQTTIPKGLLKDHKTPEGTWAKIVVLSGKINYFISTNPVEEIELNPDNHGVIEPEVSHYLQPKGHVQFYLEFYK